MAEISPGRSLKPNISKELKLGYIYVLWLKRLKKTSGNAMGGKGLTGLILHLVVELAVSVQQCSDQHNQPLLHLHNPH